MIQIQPSRITKTGQIPRLFAAAYAALYSNTEDSTPKMLANRPLAAYVEQVYQYGDFGLLGIGT